MTPTTRALLRRVSAQLSLAVRNRILFANARRRNDELAALLAVAAATSSSLRLPEVLAAALEATLAASSADAAEVWLVRDDELVLESQRGLRRAGPTRLRIGEGLPGLAVQQGRPVARSASGIDGGSVFGVDEAPVGEKSWASPLKSGDEIVGVLAVTARHRDWLSSRAERRLLAGVGEQIAVAVENARLHERVLEEAVLEERVRLARELHDGLAQVLGYVNTKAIGVRRLLALDRLEDAERHVTEMQAAARRVYSDVREEILGLRSSRGALAPSLRAYLDDYKRIAGIEVELVVDGRVEQLRLPLSTEIQLLRIAQEALANVRKHARARTATVTLSVDDHRVSLAIDDDGRGFEPDRPRQRGWPRFGLQTMRERATALGADYELTSLPGEGTHVAVSLPVETNLGEYQDAGIAR